LALGVVLRRATAEEAGWTSARLTVPCLAVRSRRARLRRRATSATGCAIWTKSRGNCACLSAVAPGRADGAIAR
jgi:hypothetical protein